MAQHYRYSPGSGPHGCICEIRLREYCNGADVTEGEKVLVEDETDMHEKKQENENEMEKVKDVDVDSVEA